MQNHIKIKIENFRDHIFLVLVKISPSHIPQSFFRVVGDKRKTENKRVIIIDDLKQKHSEDKN